MPRLAKWLLIGCAGAVVAVTVLTVVSWVGLFIGLKALERSCWPMDVVDRLPDDRLGHPGPVWGQTEGGYVIVFGWDEGLLVPGKNQYGGSLYSVRPDGTDLTLLSPSVGDGREVGCYGAPLDDGPFDDYRVAFDTSPAISPDGSTVAFATERHSVQPAVLDIVTVALGSGELRRVTPVRGVWQYGDPAEIQYEPAWSPDGTRLAFLEDDVVHTMALDGSGKRSLAPGIWSAPEPPAWSPDGTRLAFRGWLPYEESWALYVVDSDGSNLTRALEGAALPHNSFAYQNLPRFGDPVWSPDGRRIAILLYLAAGRTSGVHVLDVETGAAELLARGDESPLRYVEGPLAWTPDGAEVLFFSHTGKLGPGLYAVTTDGERTLRRFASKGGNLTLGLAWSPDGARLAIRAAPLGAAALRSPIHEYADTVLWMVSADGSDVRVLVRVGPDGELVGAGDAGQ